jgi:hypothetical protein
MLEANACSQGGDSGGPWTQANLEAAIGIHSAGPGCGDILAEPLHRALNSTGTVMYGEQDYEPPMDETTH